MSSLASASSSSTRSTSPSLADSPSSMSLSLSSSSSSSSTVLPSSVTDAVTSMNTSNPPTSSTQTLLHDNHNVFDQPLQLHGAVPSFSSSISSSSSSSIPPQADGISNSSHNSNVSNIGHNDGNNGSVKSSAVLVSEVVGGERVVVPFLPSSRKPKSLFGFTVRIHVNDEVRLSIWILFFVAALCVLVFFIYRSITDSSNLVPDADQLSSNFYIAAVSVGGVFSAFAILLSLVQIRHHLSSWVHAPSQRCVVRILFMVPVYSISAWLGLTFYNHALYIDFLRQCYEAFVIYTFMILLTKYLGGHEGVIESFQYKQPVRWPEPLCWIKRIKPDIQFLQGVKYGTLQYAIVAPLFSFIAVCLDLFDLYDADDSIRFDRGYVYVAFVINISQMISLYCLVWLYLVLKNELAPFSPGYKFIAVKAVVFFTWWQGVALEFFVKMNWITNISTFSAGQVQVMLQDFIVCFEMFVAAAVHKYVFGADSYANGAMKLLMEQRAQRLAEMSYKAALEKQQLELASMTPEEILRRAEEEEARQKRFALLKATTKVVQGGLSTLAHKVGLGDLLEPMGGAAISSSSFPSSSSSSSSSNAAGPSFSSSYPSISSDATSTASNNSSSNDGNGGDSSIRNGQSASGEIGGMSQGNVAIVAGPHLIMIDPVEDNSEGSVLFDEEKPLPPTLLAHMRRENERAVAEARATLKHQQLQQQVLTKSKKDEKYRRSREDSVTHDSGLASPTASSTASTPTRTTENGVGVVVRHDLPVTTKAGHHHVDLGVVDEEMKQDTESSAR